MAVRGGAGLCLRRTLSAVPGQQEPAALVWALVPLILIAVVVRSWHRTTTARLIGAVLCAGIMLGMWLAPAPVPALWFLMFPVCILGATELLGLLHTALIEAALHDPLTSVWNRARLHRSSMICCRAHGGAANHWPSSCSISTISNP